MIEIKDQFVCTISVGPYKDFILTEDLTELVYFESAGLVIPFLSVSFLLRDTAVLKYLNEGNVVNVSMGRDELNLCAMQFMLISDISEKNYTLGSNVTIKGILHLPKFIFLCKEDNYNDTSINAIKAIGNKHFSVITNVAKTFDKQNWFQTGTTDRQMLRDIWLHSYINENTFLSVGFDSNTLRVKDIRRAILEDTPWEFSMNKVPRNESSPIVHFGQFWTKNDYGNINSCIGRGLVPITFNVDTGESSVLSNKLKNFTVVGSNKLNLLTTDVKKYDYSYISDEVNSTYTLAYRQNLRNLMLFSSYKIYIPVAGPFKQFHLLDSAQLEETSVGAQAAGRSFITRILYKIKDRRLYTNLTLCKEAPNELRGENLLST